MEETDPTSPASPGIADDDAKGGSAADRDGSDVLAMDEGLVEGAAADDPQADHLEGRSDESLAEESLEGIPQVTPGEATHRSPKQDAPRAGSQS